ncbi:MAG TPA: hypothetical protein VLG45_03395 [Thermodesulfobacteriota bacterium]|nr:hypothetical protein [Thermodesulfobacteriota bacterium]
MESSKMLSDLVVGIIFGAFLLAVGAGSVYAQPVYPQPAPVAPAPASPCSSTEGISCSKKCQPMVVNVETVKASGVTVSEVSESQQVSMLAGKALDFRATCPAGSFAIGGGYTVMPEDSTIDMKEVRVTSSIADNMNPSGWNGWKVSVFRKEGAGSPDNCLMVEVRAYCIQGS